MLSVFARFIDVVELVECDQLVKREAALFVELYQPGNEHIRNTVAFDDATQAPSEHNAVHIDRALRPNRRYTDQPAYPRQRQRIHSLPEHLGDTRTLQRIVNPCRPDLMDALYRASVARHLEP